MSSGNPPLGRPPGVSHNSASPYSKRWRWELAIRFELANVGIKADAIAAHVGVSPSTLAQWRMNPEYVTLYNSIVCGVLDEIDSELSEDIKAQQFKLKKLVPIALTGLMELAMQKVNPSVRAKACSEILDREGNFAKVSRIGLATENQGGIGKLDNDTANALIASLNAAKAVSPPTIDDDSPTDKVM